MFFPTYLLIDIGSCNIKIVHASIIGKKMHIHHLMRFPTPAQSVADGKIMDADVLAGTIKYMLQKYGVREKKVILTIAGMSIITREVMLPKANKWELKSMISMDISRHFPIDVQNYVVDYKILEEIQAGKGTQYRVLLVAVPSEIVSDYIKVLEKCGLYIYRVDLTANSMVKFVNYEINFRESENMNNAINTIAVVDLGASTTNVTILSGHSLRFHRIVPNTGNHINNMLEDLSHIFEFYYSRNSGNKINKIYLAGGGGLKEGIEQYFTRILNISTEKLLSFKGVKYSHHCKRDDGMEIYYANCFGAILNQ